MPASAPATYLLLAGRGRASRLARPRLASKDGGEKALGAERAHKKLLARPIIASSLPELRRIQARPGVPCDPPPFPRIEANKRKAKARS